jgi:hypothetical protein
MNEQQILDRLAAIVDELRIALDAEWEAMQAGDIATAAIHKAQVDALLKEAHDLEGLLDALDEGAEIGIAIDAPPTGIAIDAPPAAPTPGRPVRLFVEAISSLGKRQTDMNQRLGISD